jgi:hypothetical protein
VPQKNGAGERIRTFVGHHRRLFLEVAMAISKTIGIKPIVLMVARQISRH